MTATRVPVNVIAAVACARCRTGYVPSPEQAVVLRGIRAVSQWAAQAARYAVGSGWYRRADGDLLCTEHAELGDRPLPRVTIAQLTALLPPLPAPLHAGRGTDRLTNGEH